MHTLFYKDDYFLISSFFSQIDLFNLIDIYYIAMDVQFCKLALFNIL